MLLSSSASHALRAVAALARLDKGDAVLARDLAAAATVPAHYLSKVLATLTRAGLLSAARGAKGGYRLARPAAEIRLVEVVAPFEGKRLRPTCLLTQGEPCRAEHPCRAHDRWSRVTGSLLEFLETATVADLAADEAKAPTRKPRAR